MLFNSVAYCAFYGVYGVFCCDSIFKIDWDSERVRESQKRNQKPSQKKSHISLRHFRTVFVYTLKNGTTHALVTLNHFVVTCRIFILLIAKRFCKRNSAVWSTDIYIVSMCFNFPTGYSMAVIYCRWKMHIMKSLDLFSFFFSRSKCEQCDERSRGKKSVAKIRVQIGKQPFRVVWKL